MNEFNMVDYAKQVCGLDNKDEEVRNLDMKISKAFMTLPKCTSWSIADFIINDLGYRKD